MDDLIRRYEREDITIWGCKNTPMSNQLKKANPRVKRFFSLKELGNLYLRYFTGTLTTTIISISYFLKDWFPFVASTKIHFRFPYIIGNILNGSEDNRIHSCSIWSIEYISWWLDSWLAKLYQECSLVI